MHADYSFFEYSFDSLLYSSDELAETLASLGFTCVSMHVSGKVSVWSHNLCIIMLRDCAGIASPRITGLGFIADSDLIDSLDPKHDVDTDMWVTGDKNGMRILLINENDISVLRSGLTEKYTPTGTEFTRNAGLEFVSGMVYNSVDRHMLDFYQNIGFKFTKSTDRFNTLLGANSRFTILCDKVVQDSAVRAIVFDTPNVFSATAFFTANGLQHRRFYNKSSSNVGELNHKVKGYNCIAFGNENSYTIENFIPQALPGVDFVYRQRKQYFGLEDPIVEHYRELE